MVKVKFMVKDLHAASANGHEVGGDVAVTAAFDHFLNLNIDLQPFSDT